MDFIFAHQVLLNIIEDAKCFVVLRIGISLVDMSSVYLLIRRTILVLLLSTFGYCFE